MYKPLNKLAISLAVTAIVTSSATFADHHKTKKAELGTFGVDLSARDMSVKPGDDFFMYASGDWYKNYEMPSDKTRVGAFSQLADKARDQVKGIIDDLAKTGGKPGSNEQMVSDFYRAYMNIELANKKGLEPLARQLDAINKLANAKDLTKFIGNSWHHGVNTPINSYLGTNRKDPNVYQVNVGVGGIGLPDRDYYLEDSERFKAIRAAYQQNIADILSLAKYDNAAEMAGRIVALETTIAEYLWPREKRRNRDLTLNQMSRADLAKDYPEFDWDSYFDKTGYKAPDVNVTTPDALTAAITLINNSDINDWKAYFTYHIITNHAGYLSDEIYNKTFEFVGTTLRGQKEPEPRWRRAIDSMSSTQSLGFAIGQVYVDRYFPASSKQQMSELVENLRTALGQRIQNLAWMGEETKVNAMAKLKAFRPKIGYPDVWPELRGIKIAEDDLMGNVMRLRKFFRDDSISRQDGPTDRERWGMTPQRVNAYYNSSFNEIVFPAGILQAPFFDPNADPAVNYGAIGAVIGHEMGHGFDDQGSKSDANGIQRNWWTDDDRKAFEARAQMLIDQYSAYEPIEGNFVNGKNSLGENIGDVGGLAMAYHAYKLSLNGKEAPIIDGTTGDQRFFLSWAQVWKEKRTEQSMLNQLRGGVHSPGRFRALAPRNHDAWYKAFDVQPGDKLYLAPEERVRIW